MLTGDVGDGGLRLADFTPRSQARVTVTQVRKAAFRAVDAHNHLGRWLTPDGGWMAPDVGRLLADMDACGVAAIVNLDGRIGVDLEQNLDRYDRRHPGRFATFCQLDWAALAESGGTTRLRRDLEAAAGTGARGLKVWKDLGLTATDARGRLVLPDDPRLDEVWATAGALGLPVLIHTGDPVAFFQPLDGCNERIEELADQPQWWFGDRNRFPTFERLLEALESVVARFPGTTFIGAHVGCYAEDPRWVEGMLSRYPNLNVDLGGRMAELGRQPRAAAALLRRHRDRVLFGTDAFPVTAADYRQWFRFLESEDESFAYAPQDRVPPQGRWDVHALGLPAEVLEPLYAGNTARLLGL